MAADARARTPSPRADEAAPGDSLTRFQKLATATVVLTFLLVTIGVVVRATDSGMACPTWPGCFEGQALPRLDQGFQVWIEWIHRTVAALIGFLILGLAWSAVRDHRDRPSLVWGSVAAVALVGFQAWLGRETVRLNNSGESVTAHLAAAMLLVGLLVFLLVRSHYPARAGAGVGGGAGGVGGEGGVGRAGRRGGSQRFTLLAAFAAATTFALLLFGSNVTAENAWNVFPDWPLMGGAVLPALVGEQVVTHALHRYVAVLVGLIVAAVAVV